MSASRLPLPTGMFTPEWLAESVRFTFFTTPSEAPKPLFSEIVGYPPQEVNERPFEKFKTEVGEFAAGSIFVTQLQGVRIDVAYGDRAVPQILSGVNMSAKEVAHVGPITSAMGTLAALVSRLDQFVEQATRMAFSITLVKLCPDAPAVMELIKKHSGLPLDKGDADLSWQINSPLTSSYFQIQLNRIQRWQSHSSSVVAFSPTNGPMPEAQKAIHFARFEIETNTLSIEEMLGQNKRVTFDEIMQVALNYLAGH